MVAGEGFAGLAEQVRMQEEEVLYGLAIEPLRAADAMATLLEVTLEQMERPPEYEEGHTDEELKTKRDERAAHEVEFWRRCEELALAILGGPDRPEDSSGPRQLGLPLFSQSALAAHSAEASPAARVSRRPSRVLSRPRVRWH
jgi:hypothetical protein